MHKLIYVHALCILSFTVLPFHCLNAQDNTSRTWRDASGVFVLDAQLSELSASHVKLRKNDGSVIEVRRDALSKDDQSYLLELDKKSNPFAGASSNPASVPLALSKTMPQSVLPAEAPSTQSKPRVLASPDLPPILPTSQNVIIYSPTTELGMLHTETKEPISVPVGEAYLSDFESGSRISPILMLNTQTKKIAISAGPSIYSSRRQQSSQVFIGELPRGPFEVLFESEDPMALLDHNITTGQTLATTGEAGEHGDRDLVLIEGLNDNRPVETARFRLPADSGRRRLVSQARLIGRSQALVVLDGVAYCWDLTAGKLIYQSEPQRRLMSKIAISSDLTLMTIPSEMGLHFASLLTGKDLGFLRCKNLHQIQAAFDPRGQRIGFSAGDFWGTYDYEKRDQSETRTTTWTLNGPIGGWIKSNLFVTGGGVVMETGLGIPVWKYDSEKWGEAAIWADTITMIDNSQGFRLRTLPMPHSELMTALAELPKISDLLATDTGAAVDLQYELPDPLPKEVNREPLDARMKEIIQAAGWVVDKSSAKKVVVKIAPGATRKERYQKYEPNMSSKAEEVEVTPMLSRLELRDGDKVVWSMQSRNANVSHMYAPTNQSKEEYIAARQRAIPEFFYSIVLPVRIPRQPYTYGFGKSLDHNGLWEPKRY